MTPWTREAVLRASDDWQWVPPGAEALDVAGVPVIDYPEWARMGFYAMPATVSGPVEDVVDAVMEAARDRGRGTIDWWITPSTEPPTLEAHLIEQGAVLSDEAEILAYDMPAGGPDVGPTDGIECRVVLDAQTLEDAEQVAAAVWGGSPSMGARRADQLRSLGSPLDREGGFRVVAYRAGRAIATGGCQQVSEVARLYGGCTTPDARGLGGYRATLAARIQVARDHGARLALIHARATTSLPILTRLGFTSYGQGRLYSLPA